MQMNRLEHELWKTAAWVVCPWCDEPKCVGRENCVEIAAWIAKKKDELRGEKRCLSLNINNFTSLART